MSAGDTAPAATTNDVEQVLPAKLVKTEELDARDVVAALRQSVDSAAIEVRSRLRAESRASLLTTRSNLSSLHKHLRLRLRQPPLRRRHRQLRQPAAPSSLPTPPRSRQTSASSKRLATPSLLSTAYEPSRQNARRRRFRRAAPGNRTSTVAAPFALARSRRATGNGSCACLGARGSIRMDLVRLRPRQVRPSCFSVAAHASTALLVQPRLPAHLPRPSSLHPSTPLATRPLPPPLPRTKPTCAPSSGHSASRRCSRTTGEAQRASSAIARRSRNRPAAASTYSCASTRL